MIENWDNFLDSSENRDRLFKTKDFRKYRKDSMPSKKTRVFSRLFLITGSSFPFFMAYFAYYSGGSVGVFAGIGLLFFLTGLMLLFITNPSEEQIREGYLNMVKWEISRGKYPDLR